MSTARSPHTTRPADPAEPSAKPQTGLSPTQVIGGALAAMTAAFVGSRLSMAGTIAGAAVASVVAAVASHLYTTSLRASQERVRTVFRGRVVSSDLPATVVTVDERDVQAHLAASPLPDAPGALSAPASASPARLPWRSVLVGALAVFALTAAALTVVELATGQALSGGDGTTISRVSEAQPVVPADDTTPSAEAPAAPSATPSASGSASAEAAPSTSSSPAAAPSASTSAPVAPSAAPSTTSASPSATAGVATPSAGG